MDRTPAAPPRTAEPAYGASTMLTSSIRTSFNPTLEPPRTIERWSWPGGRHRGVGEGRRPGRRLRLAVHPGSELDRRAADPQPDPLLRGAHLTSTRHRGQRGRGPVVVADHVHGPRLRPDLQAVPVPGPVAVLPAAGSTRVDREVRHGGRAVELVREQRLRVRPGRQPRQQRPAERTGRVRQGELTRTRLLRRRAAGDAGRPGRTPRRTVGAGERVSEQRRIGIRRGHRQRRAGCRDVAGRVAGADRVRVGLVRHDRVVGERGPGWAYRSRCRRAAPRSR